MEKAHEPDILQTCTVLAVLPQDRVRRRMEQVHGKLVQLLALGGRVLLQERDRALIGLEANGRAPSLEAFAATWSGLRRTEQGGVEDRVNKALRKARNR